jgi:phosphomannomutase
MAEQLIISVSGVRGIVGKNLTASIATDYGCAFGTFLKNRDTGKKEKLSVCIGRDTRPSGQMLQSAVTAGLCAVGIGVIDLGVVTTPGVGIMARQLGCGGGVVVTASHNPSQYNGIKLLLGNGIAPPRDAAEQIKQYFQDKHFTLVDSPDYGNVTSDERTDAIHIVKVLAIVDRQAIAVKNFRVVLDSVNGAGGRVTKKMLAELGCVVSAINDEPSGLFAHGPEPTAENLKDLCEVVKTGTATRRGARLGKGPSRSRGARLSRLDRAKTGRRVEIGFALDPDGDRLAIVDETGNYIGEEYTLALAAKYIFSKRTGKAATNLSTSRMIDDIAEKAGGKVIRTAVGEANVAAAMLEQDCIIGGEGNGGVIDLRVGPVRDSLVGIALVLQLMTETGKTISQLVSEIGGYYMIKDKFAADKSQVQQILESAKSEFAYALVSDIDGYRFDFKDSWLHIRASNTEPIVRVIVEAKDQTTAQNYINIVQAKALRH